MQDDVKGDIIYKEARKLLEDPRMIRQQIEGYREIRSRLGSPGAARRTAELVLEEAGLEERA